MSGAIQHSKPTLASEDRTAIERTLTSGMIADGATRRAFEDAVASRLGVTAGLATGSGTAALTAALVAVGVAPGDEVIMPTYVCDAVSVAIHAAGARPVLCDVEMDRCMSAATVTPRLTPRTRAIVAVHPFGAVADVASIQELGRTVIEDCCQAFGAARNGALAGTLGDACVLSFHATKLLTTGEGGMALGRTSAVATRLDHLRRGADLGRYQAPPLSDLQAALGISQLDRYDEFLSRRAAIAAFYMTALRDVDVQLPEDVADRSIFFRFPLRSRLAFEDVRQAFASHGVHVRRGVDRLLHSDSEKRLFPNAERLFAETVSLPIYPSLSDDEAARVADAARLVFGKRS
ncbi:MAG TPA: DegT/DnrJ/EryC1/StrS family aminotransferase [Vicinamibacterales bacterium]|nr:DegT/DnrJ/EryC1/StrS family aminotransferase [Vicinamibacterales bacterium]